MLIRVAIVAVVVLLVLGVVRSLGDVVRTQARKRAIVRPRGPGRPGTYEWDRRRHQVARQLKCVPQPEEDREAIVAFLDAHRGGVGRRFR